MRDRPILFSAPTVRALLGGRKTQTRRVVDVDKYAKHLSGYRCTGRLFEYERQKGHEKHGLEFVDKKRGLWDGESNPNGRSAWYIPVRFRIGDRLWVREAWRTWASVDHLQPRDLSRVETIEYLATGETDNGLTMSLPGRLRPSIHMPRWASRLTLKVTDVRVQRLQEISEWDVSSEGVEWFTLDDPKKLRCNYRDAFLSLWNTLHDPEAWDQNPWAVAVSFDVQRENIDQLGKAA